MDGPTSVKLDRKLRDLLDPQFAKVVELHKLNAARFGRQQEQINALISELFKIMADAIELPFGLLAMRYDPNDGVLYLDIPGPGESPLLILMPIQEKKHGK